ncbi:MAG: DegT/DnrJ/EryC1/StrS family aminotransferase [Dehalococcoidales bacterium]|nr:DegT/DnrJ/EryC1/StrS family aminotransferase [Dehalococcoidales bacterium]
MRIPMTDLTVEYTSLKDEIDGAIQRVVQSGRFILGSEVEKFEIEMANYCNTEFAIGVSSGTDALILSLKACGIGPGDEVITTPFTFIATAMAIAHCGAVPVFADIDPLTYNIDPGLIEPQISSKTRAILPVHLFGQSADMDEILALAKKYNLKVIEDAAQAFSGEYRGRKVGSIGDAGCFSFFPSKNLGAFGDGGMVVTNNAEIAERVRMLRNHGARAAYHHILPGFNSRLDAIQAAILNVKLKHIDCWSSIRRQKAELYSELLSQMDGIEPPFTAEYNTTSANYYTVRLRNHHLNREQLRNYLTSEGIETNVYYPLSLHLQEAFKTLRYRVGDFPESELAQEQVLSLPMYPELPDEDISYVVDSVRRFESRVPSKLLV